MISDIKKHILRFERPTALEYERMVCARHIILLLSEVEMYDRHP